MLNSSLNEVYFCIKTSLIEGFFVTLQKNGIMIDYSLIAFMEERLKNTPVFFNRYMFDRINWQSRLVGLTGPRGVGKSTMMLQYMLQHSSRKDMLYVTADHIWFATHSLVELADEFVKDGGRWLCIDEAHRYKGWSREIKQIYDGHPGLQIAFTGSSVLDINKGEADLSRRALMYHMQGLSFREYLKMFHGIDAPRLNLADILTREIKLPESMEHPLPLFRQYMAAGYYPFAIEGDMARRIQQIVSLTVETDIPMYADMKASTARKLKQMLGVIAKLAPYKPSVENLSQEIKISKNNVADYLLWLEKAGMIGQLRDDTGGMRGLGKVEKVFLDNPTLMTVLSGDRPNIGNLRETFFYNQMRVDYDVLSSKVSDFRIDDLVFEIGGKNKGQRQIRDVEKGYVVKDDIEYRHGNIIPLFLFGLTY